MGLGLGGSWSFSRTGSGHPQPPPPRPQGAGLPWWAPRAWMMDVGAADCGSGFVQWTPIPGGRENMRSSAAASSGPFRVTMCIRTTSCDGTSWIATETWPGHEPVRCALSGCLSPVVGARSLLMACFCSGRFPRTSSTNGRHQAGAPRRGLAAGPRPSSEPGGHRRSSCASEKRRTPALPGWCNRPAPPARVFPDVESLVARLTGRRPRGERPRREYDVLRSQKPTNFGSGDQRDLVDHLAPHRARLVLVLP